MKNTPLKGFDWESHRTIAVDVDGTLILNGGRTGQLGEFNYPLIQLLIGWKARDQNRSIIVWSGAGRQNAAMAVAAMGLIHVVDAILAKPTAIIDDIAEWFDEQSVMVIP